MSLRSRINGHWKPAAILFAGLSGSVALLLFTNTRAEIERCCEVSASNAKELDRRSGDVIRFRNLEREIPEILSVLQSAAELSARAQQQAEKNEQLIRAAIEQSRRNRDGISRLIDLLSSDRESPANRLLDLFRPSEEEEPSG